MSKLKKIFSYVSGTSYNFKIFLKQEVFDLGVFDTYEDTASIAKGMAVVSATTTITGLTTNKLSRLRTYSQSSALNKQYILSTSVSTNGLDLTKTVTGTTTSVYVYYIDNITYTTTITATTSKTVFTYESLQQNPILFDNKPIIKDEKRLHQIEKSRIEHDVFIVRQNLPVLSDNYRLADIKNVDQLYKYGAGYFNIIDNI